MPPKARIVDAEGLSPEKINDDPMVTRRNYLHHLYHKRHAQKVVADPYASKRTVLHSPAMSSRSSSITPSTDGETPMSSSDTSTALQSSNATDSTPPFPLSQMIAPDGFHDKMLRRLCHKYECQPGTLLSDCNIPHAKRAGIVQQLGGYSNHLTCPRPAHTSFLDMIKRLTGKR